MKRKYLNPVAIKKISLTLVIFVILGTPELFGQDLVTEDRITRDTNVGFELDALPYITGGYYGSVWVGHDSFRYRAIISDINVPELVIEDGFTNSEIVAYAAVLDYFFDPQFQGWWIGSGLEYWDGKIQTDAKLETSEYHTTVFTIGAGHVWKFFKNFYLNPWVAGHLRIGGDKEVDVDQKTFKTKLFLPELSLKLGWYF